MHKRLRLLRHDPKLRHALLHIRNLHALVLYAAIAALVPEHTGDEDDKDEPNQRANDDEGDELVLLRVLAVVVRLFPGVSLGRGR